LPANALDFRAKIFIVICNLSSLAVANSKSGLRVSDKLLNAIASHSWQDHRTSILAGCIRWPAIGDCQLEAKLRISNDRTYSFDPGQASSPGRGACGEWAPSVPPAADRNPAMNSVNYGNV
jgi:hypothetical protein